MIYTFILKVIQLFLYILNLYYLTQIKNQYILNQVKNLIQNLYFNNHLIKM